MFKKGCKEPPTGKMVNPNKMRENVFRIEEKLHKT